MKKLDLSVIIINFGNTKEYTKNCLKSLIPATKKLDSEVILIDNISTDGTKEMVKNEFPSVKYIRKDKAYGFGENNNFGLEKASGKYVLFLNNDTKITDNNILKEMIEWMDKNHQAGVSSCALLDSDGKTYQRSGGYFPNLLRVLLWMSFIDDLPIIKNLISSYHPSLSYFEKEHNQDWVTGAFYLVRKEILDKVGGFDVNYYGYVEETDLSFRIKKLGFKIWYLPKWSITHYGKISYGNENSVIFEMKNLKLFYKKHYSAWQLPILSIIIKIGCLIRIPIFGKTYAKAFRTI
jgi:GT2 family glycosyltransferase